MLMKENMSSLINDFKALQRDYNDLWACLEFLQAKFENLSTSNSAVQAKIVLNDGKRLTLYQEK